MFSTHQKPDHYLLSIVTINLNNAVGLNRTIRSLQPFAAHKDVEFIFVDGSSCDESLSIAEQFYGHGNIIAEPDKGIYYAMNKGLRMAKGTFVLWLNSGDELICNAAALKSLLTSLREKNIVLLACGAEIFYEDNPSENHVHLPSLADLPFKTIPHQAAFFRRSRALEFKGYDQRYKVVGDRDLILRIYNRYPDKIHFSNLVTSRWYFGGITATGSYGNEIDLLRYRNGLISASLYYKNILKQKLARLRQVIWKGSTQ